VHSEDCGGINTYYLFPHHTLIKPTFVTLSEKSSTLQVITIIFFYSVCHSNVFIPILFFYLKVHIGILQLKKMEMNTLYKFGRGIWLTFMVLLLNRKKRHFDRNIEWDHLNILEVFPGNSG
jgi:hypothetical protein